MTLSKWKPLRPLDEVPPPPEFPVAALPKQIADMVCAVSKATTVPKCFVGGIALGAMSTACMGLAQVRMTSTWIEDTHLFVMAVAPSGSNKSGAFKPLFEPIYGVEGQRRAAYKMGKVQVDVEMERLLGEKKGLLSQQKSAKGDDVYLCENGLLEIEHRIREIEVMTPPRLIVRDTTPEALVREMGRQAGRLSWVHPEGGQVISRCTTSYMKPGESKLAAICLAYSGETITVTRITREEIDVTHPMLTMVLAAQPHILQDVIRNRELEDLGFTGRLLVAVPRSLVGERSLSTQAVPQEVASRYAATLASLLDQDRPAPEDMPSLTFTAEAAEVFKAYRDKLESAIGDGGRLSFCGSWGSKAQGRIGRLAGLFHLTSGHRVDEPIGADTLRDAVRVSEWACEHFTEAWLMADPRGAEARLKKAWMFIEREDRENGQVDDNGVHYVYESAVAQRAKGTFTKKEAFDEQVNELVERGQVCREKADTGGKPGRPPVLLKLNPKLRS